MTEAPIYFLSFCTEGFPYDEGYDITKSAYDIRKNLKAFFTDILIYTPRTLKEIPGSEPFCNLHPGEFLLNPGLNKLGCGDFKAFLIDHTLKQIPEGSIVIYHDCNFEKYPQYWQTDWQNIRYVCNYFLDQNQSDFFIPFESASNECITSKVRQHGKRFTTRYVFPNPEEIEIVEDCFELASSRFIIRNTQKARDFFLEYKSLCENKDLLTKWPNPAPHPEYTHSCPEQHVLNLLVYKHILQRKLNPNYPIFRLVHRRLRIDGFLERFENTRLIEFLSQESNIKKNDNNF
jgi:hypothetical protein